MVVLFKIVQVVLALSILILIHEAGHFFWSKIFGIRVEKFYLFFDIGGKRLFSTRSKWFVKIFPKAAQWETEYGIGILPLGGYCKISGMVDESMDLEQLKQEPKEYEFRTHPVGQRILVMAGGVINNFLFAVIAYAMILGIWGRMTIPNEGNAIYVNDLAYEMGFRTGDRILAFDDYTPKDFSILQADLVRREVSKVTVLRGNDTLAIYVDGDRTSEMLNTPGMFDLAYPFIVDTVASAANSAALRRGDRLIAIDGTSVEYLQQARPLLQEYASTTAELTVLREGDSTKVEVAVDSLGQIGVLLKSPEVIYRKYGFWEAIPAGFKQTGSTIGGYVKDLKLVATPKTGAYKSVGSFIAIGRVFPEKWNWYYFMNIIALLSIMLAVINLLPIPGLDGGHIVFGIFEAISGRTPSEKFMMVAQTIGMVLLMMLMFLAIGNDITSLFR